MTESAAAPAPTRKRPAPGERREQILQTLAAMLQERTAERITTAALAARLGVSEAALYRHFASKAQMFEGLIDFIEQTLFTLANQIAASDDAAPNKAARISTLVLQFGERNPGLVRVMVGDALVLEHERLQQRVNHIFDRIESLLRQVLNTAPASGIATPMHDAEITASVLTAFIQGRLQRHARSGFRRLPTDHLPASLARIL